MNETFEKIYNENNTGLNGDMTLFEKVYTEAEMLNEMNPKLRALLAAGLIGTASLGAASCSMPTDDPYDVQYTIEQSTPENPEETKETEDSEDSEEITDFEEIEDSEEIESSEETKETEDSEDSEDFEDPESPKDSENPVTFETLGVTPEHAAHLIGADEYEDSVTTIITIDDYSSFVYKNSEDGFVPVEFDRDGEYKDGSSYISYINDTDNTDWYLYYVPVSMKSDFETAIAAYKTVHAE